LDNLDKTRRKDAANEFYAEFFPVLLWPALALVGVELVLRRTRMRKFP
jgi:hypothetical protein